MKLQGIRSLRPIAPRSQEPASTQRDLERPTADDIYEQVLRNGRRELDRSPFALAVSGLVGGLTMGLTPLAMAIMYAQLGGGRLPGLLAHLFYPLGFIAVILGRGQLFTENTLYPVALVLSERGHLLPTLRLWAIVLGANVGGALLFAFLAVRTRALDAGTVSALAELGVAAVHSPVSHLFWSGVMGGWIIALMAWMVSGSHSITGSVMVIWLLTFVVGLGGFAHCIATSGEVLAAVLAGALPARAYLGWLLPAVLGNVAGGTVLVTLLEYGQTRGS